MTDFQWSYQNRGGGHLHSCVVICEQCPTDQTHINTYIFNVELWPLITDFQSKKLPFSLADYKYTPFSHASCTYHHWTWTLKHWFFTLFSPFTQFCNPYCRPPVSAVSVKNLPFPLFFFFFFCSIYKYSSFCRHCCSLKCTFGSDAPANDTPPPTSKTDVSTPVAT